MEKTRVLYVSQEIQPFLPESEISETVRNLPQGIHEAGKEIRVFMPRYGCINERRHQLHEVIRLSGMNLIIDDTDHPLIIKVASIPVARMQVYFIDNEEYFKRKAVHNDDKEKFFDDNDERAMFFCRGVIETVKKLGWKPDVIHCHGWMTAFMPLYLRKLYADEPHFADAKIVYSAYNSGFKGEMDKRLTEKLKFDGFQEGDISTVESPSANNLHKLAIEYSDAVAYGSEELDKEVSDYIKSTDKPVLDFQSGETRVTGYSDFYDKVIESNTVLVD